MRDSYGRKIEYMRISITDRCNLRCRYCMPDGINLIPMEELLTYEEILAIVKEAVDLGISKFKITGGEPLVRNGCCDLISMIKKVEGVDQVTLTTNGILLKNHIEGLKMAGIDGINISLDTLKPDLFEEITRFPKLPDVLEGIRLSLEAGIKVKLNCVLQKGLNEYEWKDILTLAKTMPLDVRFIELMPIGEGNKMEMISNQWLFAKIMEEYKDVQKDESIHGNGPAVYYKIPGFKGSLGLISALHGKFCNNCNRIRMTSTGEIKPCLCFEKSISVKDAVRNKNYDEVSRLLRLAIMEKPKMHHFEEPGDITERKRMVQIGG